eukprot:CAMPEP_0194035338 /NCGR_PEP_ID=MMETSP0009_2-20130614/7768_1 /TAXON_ID=210454 /ORGANISM="Grammatophora oceanica, Strain CCMP 410" /LENGTH=215 /DNA_ID=CAMNT_0038676653 /DNA_START=117 /DNA_END=761 /DNA_ORIENTATION=+
MSKSNPQDFWNQVGVLMMLLSQREVDRDHLAEGLSHALGVPMSATAKWQSFFGGIETAISNPVTWNGRGGFRLGSGHHHRECVAVFAAASLPVVATWDTDNNNSSARIPSLDSAAMRSLHCGVKHELLPCYYDSALEEAILCLTTEDCANNTILFSDPFENTLKLRCNACGRHSSGQMTLQECAGCGRVVYCNKACQTVGWRSHRNICASKRERR